MRAVLAVVALVSLAGCGYSRGERAVSGGLLGAGAGAGVSALTGGGIGTGALIGGGLGAATLAGLATLLGAGLCETDHCGGEIAGFAFKAALVGVTGGGLLGAALGSLVKEWRRVAP